MPAIGGAGRVLGAFLVHALVPPRDLARRAVVDDAAAVEQQRARAQLAHAGQVVADEEHRAAFVPEILHAAQAAVAEMQVADRQHLVDDQDLRLEVRRHRKRQPHEHAAGVVLHRRVDELLELGERDDRVELADDLRAEHAEDGAVQEHVFPAGQLGMKAGADFQQARHAAGEIDVALGGRRDPRQHFQQRALAGAVGSDDADDLADVDPERDVLQRPERPRALAAGRPSA